MEQGRARMMLKVDKLEDSLAFYIDQLGWRLIELVEGNYAALLSIAGVQDKAVLVSHKDQSDEQEQNEQLQSYLNGWLQPNHTSPQPGSLVYIGVPSVAEMEMSLRSNGCHADMLSREEPGHIRELLVPTIDGYTLVYWEELFPTYAEILGMFEVGATELECAIAELSEAQLSLKEHPDKWSIREHVLHVIDLELVAMHKVKFALAEPGRMYQGNSFQPDDWQQGLAYAERPIMNELQLFRAVRWHILGLCKHLPDALSRTIRTPNREETVGQLLKMMAGHANHHIRAIWRIRKKHGC